MTRKLPASKMISRAKIQMMKPKPFFSDLAIMLGAIEEFSIPTAATDGEHLYYNPEWIEKLSQDEVTGAILHEVLHAALGHLWRKGNRDMPRWNLAADYAVNAIIHDEEHVKLPKGHIYSEKYINMSAEEIYKKLKDTKTKSKCPFCGGTGKKQKGGGGEGKEEKGGGEGDKKKKDGGEGDKEQKGGGEGDKKQKDSGEGDKEKNGGEKGDKKQKGGKGGSHKHDGSGEYCPHCSHAKWGKPNKKMTKKKMKRLRKRWEGTMKEISKHRGDTPTGMERYVKKLDSKEDWKQILVNYLANSKSDFDFMTRDRRMMGSPFYLPDMRDEMNLQDVIVVFDTSGSVSDDDLSLYFSETKEIINTFPNARGWVTDCDCEVYSFEPIEKLDKLSKSFRGYGGTSHVPVFQKIEEEKIVPSVVICFTDLYTQFPIKHPPYPVLWVVNQGGDSKDAPFGRTIRLKGFKNDDRI